MSEEKKIDLLPDSSRFPAATEITPEQIENASGEERQRLVEQQVEQLRKIHQANFLKRMGI